MNSDTDRMMQMITGYWVTQIVHAAATFLSRTIWQKGPRQQRTSPRLKEPTHPRLSGIVAAFALGASAVQIGTAYLHCPEAQISPIYRAALKDVKDNETAITNVFTGRPARGIVNRLVREVGPMSDLAPDFPLTAAALAPLRAKSEMTGSADFTPLWSGQAARLNRELPAAELTKQFAEETLEKLRLLQTMASAPRA